MSRRSEGTLKSSLITKNRDERGVVWRLEICFDQGAQSTCRYPRYAIGEPAPDKEITVFEAVSPAPPDAIFGLNEAMRRDPRPDKINLGVGVYKDEAGRTPILNVVKQAEERLLGSEKSKSYLPIDGHPRYAELVRELVFGPGHPALKDDRVATVHTPGGTGALRVSAELVRSVAGSRTPMVWLSSPSWANHPKIFAAAGLETRAYAYYDAEGRALNLDGMLADLEQMQAGDLVVLHGCCHNPTGVDPDAAAWERVTEVVARRGAVPLVDFAYHGFSAGLDEDAAAVRAMAAQVQEMLVCTSFSKNFGLYSERVGAVHLLTGSASQTSALLSRAKSCVRTNYSNPPLHGAAVVATVLDDGDLTAAWHDELADMRRRIHDMRGALAAGLDSRGVHLSDAGNGFITRQNGMFSFAGLSPEEVERLQTEHAVYILGSGRINVAGITPSNIDRLCDAVAEVRS